MCRLCASVRLSHSQDWFYSWVPGSVFIAGQGGSFVNAWYSTSIDIEEVLSDARQGDFQFFVPDVVKSFDTVDRAILGCAVGRLGLPAWFLGVCFSFRWEFVSVSSLQLGLELHGPGMEAFSEGDFSAWSLLLPFMPLGAATWRGIPPQLYADNVKCSSYDSDAMLASPQYNVAYVKAVEQEASPTKCVLLSTSKSARKRTTEWRNANAGCSWAVKLDVRGLGGHLDAQHA